MPRLGPWSTEVTTGRPYMPSTTSVTPGTNFTFTSNVTAPVTPGAYNFQWRMLQDNVEVLSPRNNAEAKAMLAKVLGR